MVRVKNSFIWLHNNSCAHFNTSTSKYGSATASVDSGIIYNCRCANCKPIIRQLYLSSTFLSNDDIMHDARRMWPSRDNRGINRHIKKTVKSEWRNVPEQITNSAPIVWRIWIVSVSGGPLRIPGHVPCLPCGCDWNHWVLLHHPSCSRWREVWCQVISARPHSYPTTPCIF